MQCKCWVDYFIGVKIAPFSAAYHFFACYFLYDLGTFFFREKLPSPTKLTFCAKIELDATQLLAMQIFFYLFYTGLDYLLMSKLHLFLRFAFFALYVY